MTIEEQLAQANARILELEGAHAAAAAQAITNNQNLLAVTAERDGLNERLSAQAGEITALQSQLTQAAQDFQAYQDAEPERINAALARELAKSNVIEPVATLTETQEAVNPGEATKPELKGLKKVQAAFEAQAAKRK